MDSITFNNVVYQLPESTGDVVSLVKQALSENTEIRVRGSGHSVLQTFSTDVPANGNNNAINLMLAKMDAVTFDETTMQVTVQAGCHLGVDPFDPTDISTLENSLCYQLWKKGWAVPDLGGITHQAVGGFLSTGSSGGSLKYAFDEMLTSITLVSGKGEVVTFNKSGNLDDPFYAAGVSMGLLGIVVSATFQCVPTFNITGSETISTVDNCAIDLFGDGSGGKPSLQTFFYQTDYTRLMWWPQEKVTKMVVWQAKQMQASDYNESTGTQQDFKPKPYQEVPAILGTEVPAEVGADLIFTAIGRWPNWLQDTLGNGFAFELIKKGIDEAFYPFILPKILDIFVPIDNPQKGPQTFWDYWWHGIPMDNQMSDKLIPVKFTELWIPVEKSAAVMSALRDFYTNGGPKDTGAFSCEVYCAKKSDFWMSPSYQTDVIRIDVFWWGNNLGNPVDFYQPFWDLLAPFDFRCHWGKYMPAADSSLGNAYMQKQYPHWADFVALREEMDPEQIFVNDYWRGYFNITAQVPAGAATA